MKKSLIFTALISISLFAFNHIKADVSADYDLDVNIGTDYTSSLNFNINLENNSDTSLISSYAIDLPFVVTNIGGSIDGKAISVNFNTDSGISTIKIDFLGNIIRPNQKAKLSLSIFTSTALKDKYGTKQLYLPLPSSNYKYNSISTSVIFPNTLGKVSYSSEVKYTLDRVDDNFSKLSMQQNAGLLIMWGSPRFNVSFDTTFENRKETTNHALYDLIPNYANQTITYIRVPNADYALVDKLNNNFAFLNFISDSTLKVSSSANVEINDSQIDTTLADKYNWALNLDSILGQKIYSQISQASDSLSKLKAVNDFLIGNFDVSSDKVNLDSLKNIWNSDRVLNQLQYCYLIVSTSEYLGLNSRIEYGYNIFTDNAADPTLWCSVNIDTKNYDFDFKNQKSLGYSQISDSSIDRLKVGIWHPLQTYNNILGILQDTPIQAQFDETKTYEQSLDQPQIRSSFPSTVFSGEFYSGDIVINNTKSSLLKFSDLKINNNSVLNNIKVGDLTKAVMPLQENTIKIDYLREDDFILNLSRQVDVTADFGDLNLSTSSQVRFEPDYKLLGLFIVILIVTISILIYLLSRLIKRKL